MSIRDKYRVPLGYSRGILNKKYITEHTFTLVKSIVKS